MDEEAYTRSLKADIIPIINAELQMDEDLLYSLSIEVLNELFGILQAKTIPVPQLREIISTHNSTDDILSAFRNNIQAQVPVTLSESVENNPSTASEVFSHDSIKEDIIPVIQMHIDVSYEKLFSLSIELLNEIFGLIESGFIPATELESILNSTQNPAEIKSKIQEKLSVAATTTDSLKEDLITGILFNIPEAFREKIEEKLREIADIDELTQLSQYAFPELMSSLGIEAPAPQPYDEKADIRAGILAQLPPSLRGVIGDRLQEIDDLDQLYRLSQMNYVQIQQSLGLAPQSATEIPPEFVNPVDTASQTRTSEPLPTPSAASSASNSASSQSAPIPPEQSERLRAQLQERREKNKVNIEAIRKMAEKVWKVKIAEGNAQTPEAMELIKKLDILMRVHPTRVEKILSVLKNTKDKKRFKALFEWYVYSHRIEEIETYVEHWQGQVQGIGGFRAAISVSRFDPIVEHMPTKEVEGVNLQAKRALERVHNPDLHIRARGVSDIKQISNYLLQKAR
ncbi:MAG: hypothetical protein ACTSRS_14220 [Candidatus Helarchaeota archaeon]